GMSGPRVGGGRSGEDAEPAERISPLEAPKGAFRNTRPAHAVGAVAAADEMGSDVGRFSGFLAKADARFRTGEIVNADVLDLEQNLAAGIEARGDQIFDDLLLAVDGDVLADEIGEVEMMQRAAQADVDAAVHEPLVLQPR